MGVTQNDYDRFLQPMEDRMIHSIWRIVRDPDDADDGLQDALAKIWGRMDQIRRHPNPQALVLRICVNSCYDILRRRARRIDREGATKDIDTLADPGPSSEEQLSSSERENEVLRAIASLSRKQASAVLMRFMQQQSYGNIAQALGCNESTARVHVTRGRTRPCKLLSHLAPRSSTGVQR